MDIDISDILADVSTAHHSSQTGAHAPSLLSDTTTTAQDHHLLVRSWTSERAAPDLLPYPTELMQRVTRRIHEQIERIEDLTSSPTHNSSTNNQNLNLILSILQTDLSRTQFIVRSLLRQRLAKITKYAMFYLTALQPDTKRQLLSVEETLFVQRHQALLGELYEASFLGGFPGALRRLDDRSGAGGERMVEGPDAGGSVIVRCLAEEWDGGRRDTVGKTDGLWAVEEEEGEGLGVELRMKRGQVWVVRWRDVRRGVVGGELELL